MTVFKWNNICAEFTLSKLVEKKKNVLAQPKFWAVGDNDVVAKATLR